MCVISAVMNNIGQIPLHNWTLPAYKDLTQVLEAIRKLDEKLGQKDCVDLEKAKILERIEERLATIPTNSDPQPTVAYVVYGVMPGVARWNVRIFLNENDALSFASAAQESNDTLHSATNLNFNKYDIDTSFLPNVQTIYSVETLPLGPYNP